MKLSELKRFIKSSGSIAEFCRVTGVSPRSVHYWLKGRKISDLAVKAIKQSFET